MTAATTAIAIIKGSRDLSCGIVCSMDIVELDAHVTPEVPLMRIVGSLSLSFSFALRPLCVLGASAVSVSKLIFTAETQRSLRLRRAGLFWSLDNGHFEILLFR